MDSDLEIYYKRIFPSEWLIKWLSYGQPLLFHNRELSFTIKDDIFVRFLSYSNLQEFKLDLERRIPKKIDIGAVFNHRPRNKAALGANKLKPQWRELVIDIDMTDYDSVRFCCQGADICKLCWPLMQCAVKVVDVAMREDFGFTKLLWVYSGRRGVHLWVCDQRARQMDEGARRALVSYFEVFKNAGEGSDFKQLSLPSVLHPHLKRSCDLLSSYKDSYLLKAQNLLENDIGQQKVLEMVKEVDARGQLSAHWKRVSTGQERWVILEKYAKALKQDQLANEVLFQFMYPRLDAQVSLHLNHLLKSPFCVHPKTGKVCVPIDPRRIDEFDPFNVPTLNSLMIQLNEYEMSDAVVSDWDKTDMIKYSELMKYFLDDCISEAAQLAPAQVRKQPQLVKEAFVNKENVMNF